MPILVTTFMPATNVLVFEIFDGIPEFFDHTCEGDTVEEHLIDLLADGMWQLSNCASAAVVVFWGWLRVGGCWLRGGWFQ
jgi:hypothetical protein